MNMRNPGFVSAMIYTAVSVTSAVIFYIVTTVAGSGKYDIVARLGGAAWVFLLLMIILMPIVTPRVKKKLSR